MQMELWYIHMLTKQARRQRSVQQSDQKTNVGFHILLI